MADAAAWDATLALLRWKQTRRGYDGDDKLLATGFSLLQSDADGNYGPQSPLRVAETKCNIPADRIATELIHFALLLITKPRRDESGANVQHQSRAVLKLLHLALKALRATSPSSDITIPMNACNLLLAAMADTLENLTTDGDAGESTTLAIVDVRQIFVFLFGMTAANEDALATPSFNMYKPPTNVYTGFMQRACTAVFAQLAQATAHQQQHLVKLAHAIVRVFQELQSTQVNKKKVFVAIAKTSFREIVGYRHALRQHLSLDGVQNVLDLLDRIIVDALFDSEHLREYDGALVHIHLWKDETKSHNDDEDDGSTTKHKAKKQRRKQQQQGDSTTSSLVSYQRHLFDELKAFLADTTESNDTKESIGSLLEVLVRGFSSRIRAAANDKIEDTRADLKSSKKRVANVIATTSTTYSPFKFWAELCGVAFSAFQTQGQDDAALAMLVTVYDSLFKALCESDVYRVTEDTEEQEQFYMMQTILSRFIELLRSDAHASSLQDVSTTTRVSRVVSNAVKCTPNLVNSSLISIFEVVGAYGESTTALDALSASMVELLHAYESMRLVDAFLKSCCATDDENSSVAAGLHSVFAHSATETALRRTYMTLPPGQLEIVWRLLTDKLAVLCGSRKTEAIAAKMALVRFLFAVFLQEIHITPQNKAKVGELMVETNEKLFATLAGRASTFQNTATKTKKKSGSDNVFSVVERELFSLFGEFLALYDGLAAEVRSKTLDVVLESIENKVLAIMTSLLAGSDGQVVGAAAGIVKIGVHWLRRHDNEQAVASLIVDRVVQWRCWDAVAFYLPELVDGVSDDQASSLYCELLHSYLKSESTAAARILRDAAFYEITTLQRVAPQVFTRVLTSTEFQSQSTACFEYLLSIPIAYVDVSHVASAELLCAVLRIHKTLATQTKETSSSLPLIATWIERFLIPIASNANCEKTMKLIASWTEFLLVDASSRHESNGRLVNVAIKFLTTSSSSTSSKAPSPSTLDKALTKLLAQKSARGHTTSATVLEAIAGIQDKTESSTSKFADALLSKIEANASMLASLESDHSTTSFQLLTALVKYLASLPESSPSPAVQARRAKIVALMQTHMREALAVAMQSIVHNPQFQSTTSSSSSSELTSSHHKFFTTFCASFHLLRPTVTLETFGSLLAVALVLATPIHADQEAGKANDDDDDDQPLACLVQHASKDEFRLVVATLLQELRAPKSERVVAALKTLVFVLETDKKLSNSRRQLLSEHKSNFVGLFGQVFSRTLHHEKQQPSETALCVWNLRVFVLFYCKAELFTWKPHELLQIFLGFQPLTVIAATATGGGAVSVWTPQQVHQVWLLSYNLVLRIVRHHFASLINGISHMVDALTALLRVLVATSALSSSSAATSPAVAAELTAYTTEWSSNLSRLLGYLKPHDAALRKHVVYLLIAYLRGVTQGKLSLALQHKLRPGVFALLEMCSLFEKEQLYASLDSTGKSLLKSLDTSYKLTYRYAGKV